ncbi:MAG TPA: hypothetical protein VLV31_10910 [Candidatus Acidoferrales bacterium]|nr:hypothetical protein [Candidatus Acidoferrales bacterium]
MSAANDAFVGEALQLVDNAEKNGVKIRIMGAVAIRLHATRMLEQSQTLKRNITDIDFVGYSKQKDKISELLTKAGYDELKPSLTPGLLVNRMIFMGTKDPSKHIDIFLDQLQMCHTIDYKGKLDLDYPTVSLAHLILQKMQIVRLNEKDIKDTLVLLLEHGVGGGDKETVDAELIAKTLSDDWGFYYTVTTNLNKIRGFMDTYNVAEGDKAIINKRLDALLAAIEAQPKSFGWKMRAKVGTKKKWYNEVEEVERASHLAEINESNSGDVSPN